MTPLPTWRWLLFCAMSSLWFKTGWRWSLNLMGWCVLPEWVASPEEIAARKVLQGESPF